MDIDQTALALEDQLNELEIAIQYAITGMSHTIMYNHVTYRDGMIDGLRMAKGILEQFKEYQV